MVVGTTDETEKNEDLTTSQTDQETSQATYTQAQLDELVRKTRSDALAEVGRLRKSSDDAVKTAQAAQTRLDKLIKEQEEAEIENARENPEALSALRERQARRRVEAERDQARQEANDKEERLKQYEAERAEANKSNAAVSIATRLGVDPVRLTKLAKYTDGTPEAIEEVAKELPKLNNKAPLRVDSGGHIGGQATYEDVRDAYIKDPRSPAIRERYLQMRKERKG